MSEKINVNKSLNNELNKGNNIKNKLELDSENSSNIIQNSQILSQKKVKNANFVEIENILKSANKLTLKKYSTNLDKKINYLKNKNIQNIKGNQPNNNYSTINKTKKISMENTGTSTTQNYQKIIKRKCTKKSSKKICLKIITYILNTQIEI